MKNFAIPFSSALNKKDLCRLLLFLGNFAKYFVQLTCDGPVLAEGDVLVRLGVDVRLGQPVVQHMQDVLLTWVNRHMYTLSKYLSLNFKTL